MCLLVVFVVWFDRLYRYLFVSHENLYHCFLLACRGPLTWVFAFSTVGDQFHLTVWKKNEYSIVGIKLVLENPNYIKFRRAKIISCK